MGLGGVGDLIVTCFSRHSRNRAVGERLGKGERLADIIASMQMVAEGVPATYSASEAIRKLGIEAPIIDQMRAILDGAIAPADALTQLLSRDPKRE
jgi:glycerol-3-phosphate dehydrogenase (NAD(P)+)